jgi:hypothetical protein
MSSPIANAGSWIAHQARVWRWGAGALLLIAVAAIVPAILGGLLAYFMSWAFALPFTGLLWFLCALALAPFVMPTLAAAIADKQRADPAPTRVDLIRRQTGIKPRFPA